MSYSLPVIGENTAVKLGLVRDPGPQGIKNLRKVNGDVITAGMNLYLDQTQTPPKWRPNSPTATDTNARVGPWVFAVQDAGAGTDWVACALPGAKIVARSGAVSGSPIKNGMKLKGTTEAGQNGSLMPAVQGTDLGKICAQYLNRASFPEGDGVNVAGDAPAGTLIDILILEA